ncbi:MAG: S41 family peptidase [Bacteroidota bacterium]
MTRYKKIFTWFTAILLAFSVGFITDVNDNYFEISKNLDIFGKLYREINSLYVDETDPSKLMRTGIDAMLNSLDPYTNYISEEEVDDLRFMTTGQYGGIGALVGKRNGKMIVMEPYEDYPADEAGIKAGDQLIRIDGKAITEEMEVIDVRNILRGQKGSQVIVEVSRSGKLQKLQLRRDRIKVDNVPYYGMVNKEVGYISLTGFTQDAGKEVQMATESLKKKHPRLKGIILDLRGNPGGRLDEAVNVANVFVPQKEVIVETRGRMNGTRKSHAARRTATDTEIPLVVLVNHRSASASEIVAGSIQDLDRGVIVGRRSFGKGLVQNIRPLSYNTQVKVTTAKYYTPSGRCIQAINYAERAKDGNVVRIPDSLKNSFQTRNGRTVYDGGGIEPDVVVALPEEKAVTKALIAQGLIFDFATQFAVETVNLKSPRDFEVSNELYREFMTYVNEREFSYDTEADRQLDKLTETLQEEAYGTELKPQIDRIEAKLKAAKDQELQKEQARISQLLKEEIIKRYYYKDGVIESRLVDDQDVSQAVNILTDETRYQAYLAGSKK